MINVGLVIRMYSNRFNYCQAGKIKFKEGVKWKLLNVEWHIVICLEGVPATHTFCLELKGRCIREFFRSDCIVEG